MMDVGFDTVLKVLFQGTFILALTVFSLSWLAQKLKAYLPLWSSQVAERQNSEDPIVNEQYVLQQSQHRERLQKRSDEKSQSYKERILLPREEWKRKKKEEEYLQFLGPAWKGEGHELGGEKERGEAPHYSEPENRRAASNRRTLEHINHEVEAVAIATAARAVKTKQKRVIQLDPEPPEESADAMTVKLRTPLGTTCCRRFYQQDTIQSVLDYITTQGFSQRVYNISTSYPRQVLDNPSQTLSDLGLGKKLALNIEEKE